MPEWCDECFRLWEKYSVANSRHEELCNALQVATTNQRLDHARAMLPKVWAAGEDRHAARKELRRHEEQFHGLREE